MGGQAHAALPISPPLNIDTVELKAVPSTQESLAPQTKSQVPKIKIKHYKSVGFLSNLEHKALLHKCKTTPVKTFWQRFLMKEEFLVCGSLDTTSKVTDDQEKMNKFFQQNKFVESRWLSMHREHTFYTPWSPVLQLWWTNRCHTSFLPFVFFIDMHCWVSLPEYLKIDLKQVTEHVNFIRARAQLYRVLHQDELIHLER